MRECLGWLTNCPDDKRCPQNWLELSYTELPTPVHCHVCEREVRLVTSDSEFENAVQDQITAAFPTVPCTAGPAYYGSRLNGAAPSQQGGGAALQTSDAPPALKPATTAGKTLFCILSSGEAVRLEKDNAVVGRSRTCDIIIPSAKVSRQHASISRVADDFYIEDLGSANGIWRDGEKVVGRVKIVPGDVFTISEESLTFELR
jgi:hypothetical protein